MRYTKNRTQEQIDNDTESLEHEIESANEMREYYRSQKNTGSKASPLYLKRYKQEIHDQALETLFW